MHWYVRRNYRITVPSSTNKRKDHAQAVHNGIQALDLAERPAKITTSTACTGYLAHSEAERPVPSGHPTLSSAASWGQKLKTIFQVAVAPRTPLQLSKREKVPLASFKVEPSCYIPLRATSPPTVHDIYSHLFTIPVCSHLCAGPCIHP